MSNSILAFDFTPCVCLGCSRIILSPREFVLESLGDCDSWDQNGWEVEHAQVNNWFAFEG